MRPGVREAGWFVMMMRTAKLYARTRALPAIAAALALSSTSALAQEAAQQAQPVTTDAAPATTTTTSTDTAPATSDLPPQTTTKTTRTVKHLSRTSQAKPAPVARHLTTQTAHPAARATSMPASQKPATLAPAAPQSAVTPVVKYQPKPAPPQSKAKGTPSLQLNGETLPIAGGALALLAIGGAAAAVTSRRRKRREQELADAETLSYEPFEEAAATPEPVIHHEQPAITAPAASAFAWGHRANDAATTHEGMAEGDDRRPGESWVERAYRGPTPNNPSVSLRNRLKRAAFFDKREREAAAGLAQPVSANAGLPGAMAGERELA
jgi:hypothetical protein